MPPRPLIVAHRGASHEAPENTLAAIALGWTEGADAAEFDVQLTRDDHIVALHDHTLRRTAGLNRPVAETTLADVRALDAGSWKHPRHAGEKIPLLSEILAALPDGKRLVVELKTGPAIVAPLARDLAASAIEPARIDLISFNVDTLRAAHAALPAHATFLLGPDSTEDDGRRDDANLDRLITLALDSGFTGLDLAQDWPIDDTLIARVRAAGLRLYTYTVNDAAVARRLAAAGIDAITTDRPAWLRARLAAPP